MGNEQVEYRKLKSLLETIHRISIVGEAIGGEDELLHSAEIAIAANRSDPQALANLEENLRNARLRILAELRGALDRCA